MAKYFRQKVEILWINDTTLAVIEHINPSTSALIAIDAETGSILYSKYGMGFSWLDENPDSLLYVKTSPHFSNVDGYEKIYNIENGY